MILIRLSCGGGPHSGQTADISAGDRQFCGRPISNTKNGISKVSYRNKIPGKNVLNFDRLPRERVTILVLNLLFKNLGT